MRLARAVVVCALCVAACATVVHAGVPATLNYQGHLTTSSGTPVSGTASITFRILDAEVGGTELWSETQSAVQVTDGLFTVTLGAVIPLSPDLLASPPSSGLPPVGGRYLEVEVDGEVLAPRTRLISVPYALATERVSGDVHTAPGELSITDLSGTELASMKGKDTASTVIVRGLPSPGHTTRLHASGTEASATTVSDVDDDGWPEMQGSMAATDTSATVTLAHLTTPGHKTIETLQLRVSPADAGINVLGDPDGDGIPDLAMRALVDTGVVVILDSDSDDDGLVDNSVALSSSGTGARLAIKTKGTGAKRLAAGGDCDDTDAEFYLDCDDDDDGFVDRAVSSSVDDSSSVVSATQGSSQVSLGTRKGWDGTVKGSCVVSDDDGDGNPENEIRMDVVPGTCAVAIKTKGTGADNNRVITSSTDTTKAVHSLDADDDGDGISEYRAVCRVTDADGDQGSDMRCMADTDDDGVAENEASFSVTPTTAAHAIKTKGTGAESNRLVLISGTTGSSSAVHGCTIDDDGDGTAEVELVAVCTIDSVYRDLSFNFQNSLLAPALMKAKEKANKTKCSNGLRQQSPLSVTETEVSCDSAAAAMTWSADDFGGAPVSLTIQASVNGSVNPIEHSSGAHLTPGGTWTNASDKNLKENFQVVDGEDVLAKVAELPISEWNYITEPDDVRHIGPTAQDFQQTFGVGSDGKSISTIDPSGIALAAIKGLYQQNQEQQKRIDELEALVRQLLKDQE